MHQSTLLLVKQKKHAPKKKNSICVKICLYSAKKEEGAGVFHRLEMPK